VFLPFYPKLCGNLIKFFSNLQKIYDVADGVKATEPKKDISDSGDILVSVMSKACLYKENRLIRY
jgi:hypothetical protein